MKKSLQKFTLLTVTAVAFQLQAHAQTTVTFDSLPLADSSYWNGSDQPEGNSFSIGNVTFPNNYDSTFQFWESGWAYSNITDSVTAGYGNLYGTAAGKAYSGDNFAIGQQNAVIKLDGTAASQPLVGVYITNSTYAYLSMRDGDAFAKKFGGATGNDPDFFKLTIRSYSNGALANDSIEFYLADFRSSDNAQDYIVNSWKYIDLSSLGTSDSLLFTLSSSDVGAFGINTPMFFNIDNLIIEGVTGGIGETNSTAVTLYPNPATEALTIRVNGNVNNQTVVTITDLTGNVVHSKQLTQTEEKLNIGSLASGTYVVSIISAERITRQKLVKL